MAKKNKPDWLATAAERQALLRYTPEIDSLAALIRDADVQRRTSIAQASASRRAVEQGVDQVLPQVRQTEQTLGLDRWTPDTTFGQVLAQQRAAATQALLDRRA